MILTEFYEQIGKVCYTAAAIDGHINPAEIAKLKAVVANEWLSLDHATDRYGTDLAHQIEVVFDWLMEQHWDCEQTLPDFKLFVKDHPTLFNAGVSKILLHTVYSIAAAFAGYNKAELVFAKQIEWILHKNANAITEPAQSTVNFK